MPSFCVCVSFIGAARLPGFHVCVGSGGERLLPEWYSEKGQPTHAHIYFDNLTDIFLGGLIQS